MGKKSLFQGLQGGGSLVATLYSLLLTATGGYVAPFLLLLGLTVVALGLNLALRKP